MSGPSPVDRRSTGSKHHLICDGKGTPLHVITTAANVNDIPDPRPGRQHPRPSPDDPAGPDGRPVRLGDKACDSKAVRGELCRRIQAVISREGSPHVRGLGKLHLQALGFA
ncbi:MULTISPECIES: hypothetical protein [unclassified Streptomyces]|uniref:hypothetical protein n=1 Tax=unclassified Streptomyces TaxID=2593676 RepID=UPI00381A8BA4